MTPLFSTTSSDLSKLFIQFIQDGVVNLIFYTRNFFLIALHIVVPNRMKANV